MISPETCISVLNWNGWRQTLACIDSLRPLLTLTPAVLVVCDNASEDDSYERLQEGLYCRWPQAEVRCVRLAEPQDKPGLPLPPVILLRTAHNGGFAAGHNASIRYVMAADAEINFFWLLNNDLEVEPDALAALLNCAAGNPSAGMFGCTVLDYIQRDRIQCAGGCTYNPWLTRFRNVCAGQTRADALKAPQPHMDYPAGAALFIRAECFRRVGLLNEEYFLFYEELDYTRRLYRAGYGIAWCRGGFVYHQGAASTGALSKLRTKKIRANYYENLSALKYTANFYPHCLPIAAPLRFALKALATAARGEFFLWKPLWRAYRDFFIRSKKIP